jgi:hypothetical protein
MSRAADGGTRGGEGLTGVAAAAGEHRPSAKARYSMFKQRSSARHQLAPCPVGALWSIGFPFCGDPAAYSTASDQPEQLALAQPFASNLLCIVAPTHYRPFAESSDAPEMLLHVTDFGRRGEGAAWLGRGGGLVVGELEVWGGAVWLVVGPFTYTLTVIGYRRSSFRG